jgi:serine/threonine-protein kinase HSL1 (negative regulator of Swe1 kinase)
MRDNLVSAKKPNYYHDGAPIPHHESMNPYGNMAGVMRGSLAPPVGPKRLSALVEQDRQSNRDSIISTNSTNASVNGRKRKRYIGPWHLGRTLGSGSVGRVRKAQHIVTGQVAAVKIVAKKELKNMRSMSVLLMEHMQEKNPRLSTERKRMPYALEREVSVMKLITHPNVTRLYDVWENHGEM